MTKKLRQEKFNLDEEEFDFENLAAEFVRALRGADTQIELSRALGYTFNQIAKWENGEKKLMWSDLIQLCKQKKLDLQRALKLTFDSDRITEFDQTLLLEELCGNEPITEFAKRCGEDRLKVTRWLNSSVEMPISIFFKILHRLRNNLDVFLERLVSLQLLPSVWPHFKVQRAFSEILLTKPWTILFIQLLAHPQCPEVSLVPKFMASYLKLQEAEIESVLDLLIKADVLKVNSKGMVDRPTRRLYLSRERSRDANNFLFSVSAKAYEKMTEQNPSLSERSAAGFYVFTTSDDSWKKIRTLYRNLFEDIQKVLDADEEDQTRVKMLSLQILDADEASV